MVDSQSNKLICRHRVAVERVGSEAFAGQSRAKGVENVTLLQMQNKIVAFLARNSWSGPFVARLLLAF